MNMKSLKFFENPPTPPGSSGVLELCLVFPLPNPPPGADQTEKNYVDPPPGGGPGDRGGAGGPGGGVEKWTGSPGGSQSRLVGPRCDQDFLSRH